MSSRERYLREDGITQRRATSSFSSSLLEAIYRSIDDESNCSGELKNVKISRRFREREEDMESFRRAMLIENWRMKSRDRPSKYSNLTSASSESSSRTTFTSSETESMRWSSSTASCFTPLRPKPIRTGLSTQFDHTSEKPKRENRFTKTKQRALQIYGDLKKAKHPMSPGGRISNFLNSLFHSKKERVCSVESVDQITPGRRSKSLNTTMCSSAPSFSRPCLSKTPSSRGNLRSSNGIKRSVKFYPITVIVDEYSRPCGERFTCTNDSSLIPVPDGKCEAIRSLSEDLKKDFVEKSCRVKSSGKELDFRDFRCKDGSDEDDDAGSNASSDLFELENLIDIRRYREELPVYGTTSVKKNQAIDGKIH